MPSSHQYLILVVVFITGAITVPTQGLTRIHAKDFIEGSLENSYKRTIHSGESFIVYGVQHNEKRSAGIEFILKEQISRPNTYVNGVLATKSGLQGIVYMGQVLDDPKSIVVITVRNGSLFRGMVHHSNGDHHVVKFDKTLVLSGIQGNTNGHTTDMGCSVEHSTPRDKTNISRFWSTTKKTVESNGLSTTNGKTYNIKLAIETDSRYHDGFDSDSDARDYMMTIIGVVSSMFQRDFLATLEIVHIGINSGSSYASSYNVMQPYMEREYPDLEFNVGVALTGGRSGGKAQSVGGLCNDHNYCEAGMSMTYGTDEFDAIHDPYILAHEIGHILGSEHTHESDQFNPVIDNCGNGGSVPDDAGVPMSYCVTRSGPLDVKPCYAYCQIVLVMGEVGKHGYKSERINQVIREHLEDSETCAELEFTTGAPPPTDAATDAPTNKATTAPPNDTPTETPEPTDEPASTVPTVLYDQLGNCLDHKFPAQYLTDFRAGSDAADDFIVPEGSQWLLKTVTIDGAFEPKSNTVEIDSVTVTIYHNDNGLPGSIACKEEDAELLAPDTSSELALFLPKDDCTLNPGHYWLQVLPYIEYGSDKNQYWWFESSTTNGNKFIWRDSEDIYSDKHEPCTSWTTGDKCYDVKGVDLCFSLFGHLMKDSTVKSTAISLGVSITSLITVLALL